MRSITSSRLAKITGCFFLALLVLTQFSHAQAGPGPISVVTAVISSTTVPAPTATRTPSPTATPVPTSLTRPTSTPVPTSTPLATYGVVNGSFGHAGACTLAGWTITGSVQTVSDSNGNCAALLSASSAMRTGSDSTVVAVLEQNFLVNPAQAGVGFFVHPFSDNPNTDFPAQTITLTDQEGKIIYQGSRNITSETPSTWWQLGYGLTSYANEYVKLTIEVSIDADRPSSPGAASLLIDFDTPRPWNNPSPDTSPGGTW